jgi:hypothetical protein
LFIFS